MSNPNPIAQLFERFKIDAPGYRRQCAELINDLGLVCGISREAAAQRFAKCEELFAAADVDKGGVLQLADSIGFAVPQLWQMEVVHSGAAAVPPSLGLVIQGQRGATLADNINNTLLAAVKVHLAARGTRESSYRLAHFFRTAFPRVQDLAKYSATALCCWIRIELCDEPPQVALFVSPMVEPGFDEGRMQALAEFAGAPWMKLWPVYNGLDATLLGVGLEPKSRRSWLHLETTPESLPALARTALQTLQIDAASPLHAAAADIEHLLETFADPSPFLSRCRLSLRHDLNGDLALETAVLLQESANAASALGRLHTAAPAQSFAEPLLQVLAAHCERASRIKAGMMKSPMHFIGLHWSAAGRAVLLGPQAVL